MHPQRPKLADHAAAELRAALAAGRWRGWLPQERLLAKELRISRSTLRDALARLREEGLIESLPHQGHRLLEAGKRRGATAAAAEAPRVVLLMPEGMEGLRFSAARWISDFRAQLIERGWGFRILESKVAYSRRPGRALARLVEHEPGASWVLRLSTREMQQWFAQAGVPCVVAGTCFPGIDLPHVDRDHRAACRHAVGRMVAAGHRRITLLVPATQKAGDVESERGFIEGTTASEGVVGAILRLPSRPEGINQLVGRMLAAHDVPTAVLVTRPENYLSVYSSLVRRGVRVPEWMSLVSCAHDSFLDHLTPRPTGYRVDPRRFSELVMRMVLQRPARGPGGRGQLLLPEYRRGETLVRPR